MSSTRSSISSSGFTDSKYDDIHNPLYKFSGNFDQNGLRDKYGCQSWSGPYQHKYAGNFLYGNMHDKGFYFVQQENRLSFFDGQFYNNKLEGYGQVIHDNGDIYEGLFKDNKRFGPGILTHADGTQDVGFWSGNGLIRLSISVSSDSIPTLCSFSKVKLLRFRKIVPALSEQKDQAKSMMLNVGVDDNFLDKYPDLYNCHVRNENSSFFDRRYYNLAQLGSEVATIEVIDDDSLETLNYDTYATEYDSICTCTNERCVQLNRQIDETNFELEKIHTAITRLHKKLQTCAKCCNIGELETETTSVHKNSKRDFDDFSESRNIEEPSQTNLPVSEFPQKYHLEKDWTRMKLQSSVVDVTEIRDTFQNEVPVFESAHKEGNMNKRFVSETEFHSDESFEGAGLKEYDKIGLNKTTCECTERQVPDIDFIILELQLLQKNKTFYEIVLKYLNSVLYKEITATTKFITPKTIEIHVDHLLAWNNNNNTIAMLRHCFRYRNVENMLSFNVRSLLIGNRTVFAEIGEQERYCIEFLQHCGFNQLPLVRKYLMKHNINPDLSDARGNTGVHFAVTNDCHKVIEQLANLGANLDVFNDECLTPLLLALLRYIATINRVMSWESAFLPEVVLNSQELEEVFQWRPHESLMNLRELIGSSSPLFKNERNVFQAGKTYGSDDLSVRSRHTQSRKSSASGAKISSTYLLSTSFIDDYVRYKKMIALRKVIEADPKQVEAIEGTISTLICFGADPNIGELPMCPVLLAIFTKNIMLVEILLKKGGNPNTVNEENLSALHILACLPFSSSSVDISDKFLEYSCNPNTKTNSDFWVEQDDEFIGNNVNLRDNDDNMQGKTPLQLICMRKDFDAENIVHQCTLVRTLIEHGAICDHYYLGHTLLSVAVLRENIQLIETLYAYVEGSKPLGENMGNALTLLGLNRFSSTKSFTNCKGAIDKLISLGMNPFDCVYAFSNVFEFFANEYSEDSSETNKKMRLKLEAEQKKLAKKFDSRELTQNSNKISVAYIRELGRKIVSIIYQYRAMLRLLLLAKKDSLNTNYAKNIANLLGIDDAMKCMKILTHYEDLKFDSSFKNILLKVLEFIRDTSSKRKARKKKKKNKAPPNLRDAIEKLNDYDIEIPIKMARYILDIDTEKYDVCYQCLKKSRKILLPCPSCGIAKFCSEICNKLNKKSRSKHPCSILFYNRMKSNLNGYKFSESMNFGVKDHDILHEILFNGNENQAEIIEKMDEQEYSELLSRKGASKSDKPESEVSSRKLSSFVTGEFIQEKKEIMLYSSCCRKNSVLLLCNENQHLESKVLNCEFHCGQVIADMETDVTEENINEEHFCVCYSTNRENSEKKILGELVYNKDSLQERLMHDEQKEKVEVVEESILSAKYDKLLGRFVKKVGKNSRLEKDPINKDEKQLSMTKNSEKSKQIQKENTEINTYLESETRSQKSINKNSKKNINNVPREQNSNRMEGEGVMRKQMKKAGLKQSKINSHNPFKREEEKNYGKRNKNSNFIAGEEPIGRFVDDNELKSRKTNQVEKENLVVNEMRLRKETERNVEKVSTMMNNDLFHEEKVKIVIKNDMTSKLSVAKNHALGNVSPDFALDRKEEKKERMSNFTNETMLVTTNDEKKDYEGSQTKEFIETGFKGKREPKRKSSDEVKNLRNAETKSGNNKNKLIREVQKKNQRPEEFTNEEKNETKEGKNQPKKQTNAGSRNKMEKTNKRQGVNYEHQSENPKNINTQNFSFEYKGERKEKHSQTNHEGKENFGHMEQIDKSEFWKKELECMIRKVASEHEEKKIHEVLQRMKKKIYRKNFGLESKKNELTNAWMKLHKNESESENYLKLVGEKTRTSQISDHVPTLNNFKGKKKNDIIIEQAVHSTKFVKTKKFPKVHQYFLELLAQYFPEFDLNGLLLPFACFVDGQLYYKFTDSFPYYCRTYSTV